MNTPNPYGLSKKEVVRIALTALPFAEKQFETTTSQDDFDLVCLLYLARGYDRVFIDRRYPDNHAAIRVATGNMKPGMARQRVAEQYQNPNSPLSKIFKQIRGQQ